MNGKLHQNTGKYSRNNYCLLLTRILDGPNIFFFVTNILCRISNGWIFRKTKEIFFLCFLYFNFLNSCSLHQNMQLSVEKEHLSMCSCTSLTAASIRWARLLWRIIERTPICMPYHVSAFFHMTSLRFGLFFTFKLIKIKFYSIEKYVPAERNRNIIFVCVFIGAGVSAFIHDRRHVRVAGRPFLFCD